MDNMTHAAVGVSIAAMLIFVMIFPTMSMRIGSMEQDLQRCENHLEKMVDIMESYTNGVNIKVVYADSAKSGD